MICLELTAPVESVTRATASQRVVAPTTPPAAGGAAGSSASQADIANTKELESIAGRALSSVEAVHWRAAIAVATGIESWQDAQPVFGLEADDKAVDAEVEKLLEPAAAVGSEVSDRQPVLEPAAGVGSEVSDRQLEDELKTLLNEGDDPYLIPSDDDDDFEDDRMLSELHILIGPPPKIEVKEEVSSPPKNFPIARSIAPAEKSIAFAPAPKSMSMPSAPSLEHRSFPSPSCSCRS